MKSFIPWVGGKSQLCKKTLAFFPEGHPGRYIEAFGGAGWLLFSRGRHANLEVFNDIDGNLINLYRCVQFHCAEFQRELRLGGAQIIPNSRELFLDYQNQLNTRGLTDIQRAARYFYLIHTSYGARKGSFGGNKKIIENAIGRLLEIERRLQDVVIENRDFEALIHAYDRPDALFYLDPPYFQAEGFYDGFLPDDHARLLQILKLLKGRFILSYNDVAQIREWYSEFNIAEVERGNNLSRKTGALYKELIITNY